MDRIRAGVIGVGILGARHSHELRSDARVELVAVSDLRESQAQGVAEQNRCRAYVNYEEMLSKEALDLVVVATPDPFHKAPVVASCQAGVKYIVLQKPMATTVQEAKEMMSAARESSSLIYMMYATRWTPVYNAIRHVIRQGLIGTPVYADLLIEDSITVPREMWGGQKQTWAHLSSSAHFLHSHLVDRIRWFFSPAEVESVYAVSQQELLGFSPDLFDSFVILDNGLKVRLKTGWIHFIEGGVSRRGIYNGMRGTIIDYSSPEVGLAATLRVNVDNDVSIHELAAIQDSLHTIGIGSRLIERRSHVEGWMRGIRRALELEPSGNVSPEPMATIVDSIVDSTLTPNAWKAWQGESPLPTGDDGLAQTAVVCAVEESAKTGQVVRVQY